MCQKKGTELCSVINVSVRKHQNVNNNDQSGHLDSLSCVERRETLFARSKRTFLLVNTPTSQNNINIIYSFSLIWTFKSI